MGNALSTLPKDENGRTRALDRAHAGMKLQSAMEYLMTYGWAMLIIAVVVAAFFSLGVFGGIGGAAGSCIPASGFLCTAPVLNSTGSLAILFGQVGSQITVTGTGCSSNSTVVIQDSGLDKSFQNGQRGYLLFNCPVPSNAMGTSFTGKLWIEYNTALESGQYLQFATISAKISTTANVLSATATTTIQPSLSIGAPSATPNSIYQGQSSSITDSGASGGSSPYTYQWYVKAPGAGGYSAATTSYCAAPSSTTCDFSTSPSTATGNYLFEIEATDRASNTSVSTAVTIEVSAQPIEYVPITISNSQPAATPVPFQQMINVTSSLYSSHINFQWTDVEFTTGPSATGSTIPAWVESGNSNTASDTAVWMRLPGAIPASGNTVIYMDFMHSNVMSASGPTGEAPQLSPSYGEYDNGATVFSDYWDFPGPSLPSGWSEANATGYAVSNGLYITGGSAYVSTNFLFQSNVLEADLEWPSAEVMCCGSSGIDDANAAGYIGGVGNLIYYHALPLGGGATNVYTYAANGGGAYNLDGGVGVFNYVPGEYYVLSTFSNATDIGWMTDYAKAYSVAGAAGAYAEYVILGDYFTGSTETTTPTMYKWVRVRTYPPGGVMPSYSFGSVA